MFLRLCFGGGGGCVFEVVVLWWCFCGGVVVVFWRLCGGVVVLVLLCWCFCVKYPLFSHTYSVILCTLHVILPSTLMYFGSSHGSLW